MDRKPIMMHALPSTTPLTWLQRLCDPASTLDIEKQKIGMTTQSFTVLADAQRDLMQKQIAFVQCLMMPALPTRPDRNGLALWSVEIMRQRNQAALAATRALNDAWLNYGWQVASLAQTWLHDSVLPLKPNQPDVTVVARADKR